MTSVRPGRRASRRDRASRGHATTPEPEPIVFEGCGHPTLGVELEVFLVDEAGRVTPRAGEVLERLEDDVHVKQEFFRATIELTTGVCDTAGEAGADLRARLARLRQVAEARGLTLVASGTHPTADWSKQPISEGPRYARFVESMQVLARRLLVTSVHVHVGVPSGEHAVMLTNALSCFVPHFLALSASSPFWRGHDTGLASARTPTIDALTTTGLPPELVNWNEFVAFMHTLQAADAVESIRDVWWDVRPHPDFGTVELRICDSISTVEEVCAVAALAQCLVAYLIERYDRGDPLPRLASWIRRENKWRGLRYAEQARLIRSASGETVTAAEDLGEWLARLGPVAERLECARELGGVRRILERGASYRRQREVYAATGSLDAVVRHLIEELRHEAER